MCVSSNFRNFLSIFSVGIILKRVMSVIILNRNYGVFGKEILNRLTRQIN